MGFREVPVYEVKDAEAAVDLGLDRRKGRPS